MAVKKAYAQRFPDIKKIGSYSGQTTVPIYGPRIHGICEDSCNQEYVQKHTPEDKGDIESFHNSLKTDYIWVTDIETFQDAYDLMEYAFRDDKSIRPHSSIEYLSPDEFKSMLKEKKEFI